MVAKFCFRSQEQPTSGSRRRAMMSSRRSSGSVAEGRGAAGKLSGEFAGGLSVMAGRLEQIRVGWNRQRPRAGLPDCAGRPIQGASATRMEDLRPLAQQQGPRAIIFDLDGTLVDSMPDIHAAVAAFLAERSHRPLDLRSEEHTSELQSLMRTSYAV